MLTFLESQSPYAISAFRIVVGFLFFCHGTSTLFAWPVAPYSGATADFAAWPSWWAGAIQFIGGLMIMIGLQTRIAAFIGSGSMAVAYFWKHQPDGLTPIQNDGDSAALFCWSLLLLVFIGSGKFALDAVIGKARSAQSTRTESRVAEPVS
ncbi:DoxX family protein [Gordonia sp. LSe1-13]|uniref:DoxX family protein n=1 Tax=Gordonia sesuvii TaxID=3116777 RepID=A0ABU7MGM9_9ACTN|nr:DoxX family protein [Gordonia sp. LSe1-13]